MASRVNVFLAAFVLGLVVLRTNHVQTRNLAVHDSGADQDPSRALQAKRELIVGMGRYNLRVATFGSSNTWGAGLPSRFDAFPYRLSPEVHNYASFAAGPSYHSVCTNTVVGNDNMYDVIIVEYGSKARDGLVELAKRLRQRFPNAIMMYLKLWNPAFALRKNSSTDEGPAISFGAWAAKQPLPNNQVNDLIITLDKDTGYWFFPQAHHLVESVVNEAVRETGGYQLRIPHFGTDKNTIMHYLRFFDKRNRFLLNARGHELIANLTSEIVHAHVPRNDGNLIDSAQYGSWGMGDSCHLWISTGGCPFTYSPSLVMKEFDRKRGRFGLEINEEGWIDVRNPFGNARALYVSFMAHNATMYPEVQLSYDTFVQIMNPISSSDHSPLGVTRTIPAGMFPPGTHRVTLTTLLTRPHTKPFLLVGISFTDGAAPSEYGFGPDFN